MHKNFGGTLEKIMAEKDLLFGCSTNKGFIQRLVTTFLPRLRNNCFVSSLIQEWEKREVIEESLRKQAYEELSLSFIQVKKKLEDLEKKGTKVFLDKNCQITARDDIVRDICSANSFLSCREPPYSRVYYKLKTLYVNIISRSHEAAFAPTALALIEKDKQINFLASADCDPSFLWWQLTLIEQAWSVAGKKKSIEWGTIPEDDQQMWLSADMAFREAFRNYLAGELWDVDKTSYRKEFFKRPLIESLIDRLMKEISLLHANDSGPKNCGKHWRTQQNDEDLEVLLPYAKKIWKKEFPRCSDPVHMSTAELAKKLLETLPSSVSLHVKGHKRFPRALSVIKATDPRIFEGGKYKGIKPNWQNFSWVKI